MSRALIVLLALGGCTTSVQLGIDDPRTYPDGAEIVRCGAVDCEPGKVCCSVTCGVCAEQTACPAALWQCLDASTGCSVDALSISGSPSCVHYVWNGLDCVAAAGCDCTGDCASLASTYVACMDAHATCWSHACDATATCPSGYSCARDRCDDASGVCTPAPTECTSVGPTPTCGCDGFAYRSACDAARAGQSSRDVPTCGACTMPDITITPGCDGSLGWMWNGVLCMERTGCACAGACDRLEPTESACLGRYESACAPVFTCGPISCRRGSEICLRSPAASTCLTVPPVCSAADCACVTASGYVSTGCTDDGHGGIVATTL